MRHIIISSLYIFAFAVCSSVIGASLNVAFADNSLDGKTFSVKITEHGKDGEATDDELIFKDGTLLSTDCEQYGFSAAPYESRSQGDVTMFISSQKSEKEGEAQWEGRVEGDEISGTFLWAKDGQDPIFYKYKGSLKK